MSHVARGATSVARACRLLVEARLACLAHPALAAGVLRALLLQAPPPQGLISHDGLMRSKSDQVLWSNASWQQMQYIHIIYIYIYTIYISLIHNIPGYPDSQYQGCM